MEQNFAKIFRMSYIASYDAKIPRIYKILRPSLSVFKHFNESNLTSFGLKRDIPKTLNGKSITYAQISKLDGEFGQSEINERAHSVFMANIMNKLKDYTLKTNGLYEIPISSMRGLRIPGRILKKIRCSSNKVCEREEYLNESGYSIGIAGIVGFLPDSEMPNNFQFGRMDIIEHRAFWVNVKSAKLLRNGKPLIILSLNGQN